MRKIFRWFSFASLLSLILPAVSFAAGGPSGPPMVIVADTRKLDGIMLWWANMYNDSHVQFMLLTIIIIPVIGVLFGIIADIVMSWIGIDLKNRDLAEH